MLNELNCDFILKYDVSVTVCPLSKMVAVAVYVPALKFSDILNLILPSMPGDKSIPRVTTLFPLGSVTSTANVLVPENPVALTERSTTSPRS